MRQPDPIATTCTSSTPPRHLGTGRYMPGLASLVRSLAVAGGMALCAQAQASATYIFDSGPLTDLNANDGSSFTLEFTTPLPLPDGIYQWGTQNLGEPNSNLPPGVSFKFTDGFTTITDAADLSPGFTFQIAGGTIDQTDGILGLYAQDPSHYDPYYGYSLFYVGPGGHSQLQDVTDPDIVGLDYDGQHIPVASGSDGTWTYSFASSVPEPANALLALTGLAMLVARRRRVRG